LLTDGFVRAESNLFTGDGTTHIRVPIPADLPASTWAHAVFLLAGLAAEIAATRPDDIDVHPRILQFTGGDDLRLINELFEAECTPKNRWGELVATTVELIFEKWFAISVVTAALISDQHIEPQAVTELINRKLKTPSATPPQDRISVIQILRHTVDLPRTPVWIQW
jgi:hypothetical protein